MKDKIKTYGKKTLDKIRKATGKLEKATERLVFTKDRIKKLSNQVTRIDLNIHKGYAYGAHRKNLERLRDRRRFLRMEMNVENEFLLLAKKKIKKHRTEIKSLKAGI